MMEDATGQHYSQIATRYDQLYGFVYAKLSDLAVKHLQLQREDRLADVGAGTGGITHLLWKKAGLKYPVICVEPSLDMLELASTREGLIACNMSADEFFITNNNQPKCSKVLLNECAHLFPDTLGTFCKAANYLPKGGLMVLIARANTSTFPMWRELKKRFTVHTEDVFKEFLDQAGFQVRIEVETYTIAMTKGEWYDKLRRRVFTVLSEFSDEQIEEGLQELDQEWFQGKSNDDMIDVKDTIVFYTATKK